MDTEPQTRSLNEADHDHPSLVCPVCRYSLSQLPDVTNCPECGVEIDRQLIASHELDDTIGSVKGLCTLGIVGVLVFAFMYWASSMVMLSVMNMYYPGSVNSYQYAGVWMRTSFVIAPVAIMSSWHRQSRKNSYRSALKRSPRVAKIPKRVLLLTIPAMLIGMIGCGLLAMMIGAA